MTTRQPKRRRQIERHYDRDTVRLMNLADEQITYLPRDEFESTALSLYHAYHTFKRQLATLDEHDGVDHSLCDYKNEDNAVIEVGASGGDIVVIEAEDSEGDTAVICVDEKDDSPEDMAQYKANKTQDIDAHELHAKELSIKAEEGDFVSRLLLILLRKMLEAFPRSENTQRRLRPVPIPAQ